MQVLLAQFWTYCCTWARSLFGNATRSVAHEIVMWPLTWLIFNLSTWTSSYELDLYYLPIFFSCEPKIWWFSVYLPCFNSYFNLCYYYYSRSIIPPFFRYYVWLGIRNLLSSLTSTMGIHNLWKVSTTSLSSFLILLMANSHLCSILDFTAGLPNTNPVLRLLFFRLCRLLALPVIPIFVFDGNDRPSVKRGVKVKGKAHWLTGQFQRFIEAFGFYWYTVPSLFL